MRASEKIESRSARLTSVEVSDDFLTVLLHDGRSVSVPLEWYPRLFEATPEERKNWRALDYGRGIRWDDVDEDISVAGLAAGRASGESERSLARWRAARTGVKA